jgi:TonB-linked SusC/RagA family outer membrane protein
MKRIASILVCLAFMSLYTMAQDIQITGKVTSADDGTALPGVAVQIKGTAAGIATNVDGIYTIEAPSNAILVFSSVGMITQEVPVEGRTTIDVVMETEITGLEEVIVVGYGVSTLEANTGSVAVVHSDDIADIPEVSFEKMLDGKVPGMEVTATTGQPGAQSQIRIRGASSINAGREPLYVVDGIALTPNQNEIDPDLSTTYMTNTSNVLAMINPNDIESISVLKDASAAAIYGSRAANGVVIITTKSGTEGKSKVNFKASYGISTLANDNGFDVMTPEQLIQFRQDAVRNVGLDPNDPTSPYYVPDSILQLPMNNWLRESTRYGKQSDYDLSVTGGTNKTRHFTSAKYQKTEGIFYGVDYESFQLRSNIDHQVNDKLDIGVKMNGFHSLTNDVAMQSLYYVNPIFAGCGINPYTPIKNEDGTYNLDIPEWSNTNPLATAKYDDQWEKQNRLISQAYVEWQPIKNLKLKTNNGIEYTDTEGRRYWSPEADANGNATLQVTRAKFSQITSSNTVSYMLLKGLHTINLLAGSEIIDYRDNYYYIYSPDVNGEIPYPNTSPSDQDDANYDENRYTMASFFGILDYNYASKYYVRASLRSDGSSKFGANYRWGTFYSIGASWNLYKESFMQGITALDFLKIRASYGVSGNDDIGNYEQWGIYQPIQYNGISGMGPQQPANPNLTWENNIAYNIAIDFGFIHKISGSIEYYNRKTTDMLLNIPLSHTSGFTELRQNVGSLRNSGFEFMIDYNILNSNVKWNVGFNIAANHSEILDLALEEGEFINPDNTRMIFREGERLLSYYLYDYAGVNPVNGEALWYDESGKITNNFNNARREILGSPEPKFLGGFNTDVSYKGIMLSVNFSYKYGNKVLIEELHYLNSDGYWFSRNQVNTALDYWKEPGDITRNPKPIPDNTSNSNAYTNPRWMFDGSYLRIKNITLSYTIPEALTNKIKVSNLRVYASALNLYTFHDVDYWDPERGEEGMGFGIYPMTKSMVIGLDLTF